MEHRPAVTEALLPYCHRLARRPLEEIRLLVLHCTELPDLATAREYAERIHYPGSRTGNSGHYYLDRDGSIQRFVPEERVAHHVAGHNSESLGIELVNRGRYPHWLHSGHQTMTEPYPEAQIEALIGLVRWLRERLPNLASAAGHDQLDRREVPASDDPVRKVRRKLDPGPRFPWSRFERETGLARLTGDR